jgi:Fe-S cluster assembly scaffold protein SufB
MAIHSFLKAEKGDPDWTFTPEQYFGKEFKMVDASSIEVAPHVTDHMTLRQNPTDKTLLAKNIKIESREASSLDLLVINDSDKRLQQICIYDILLREGSNLNFGIFVKDGKFNKHIIQVHMESGANFSIFGLMTNDVGGDTEIITKIIHQHPQTNSRQFILGRSSDGSQTVYQSTVVLDKGSNGSEASIENMNLTVGDNCRCFSKPEVYADCNSVKSSIGSMTEKLDSEKIYYLQSRGLEPQKAVQTVVKSFQNQAINLLRYQDLKQEVSDMFL